MARLEMRRENRSQDFELLDFVTLGRRADCTIAVPSLKASREHCRIFRDGAGFVIEDLGSSNGTFINGERISRAALNANDVVNIGGVLFYYHTDNADPLVGKQFNDYRILEKIGGGGMGVVYRTQQISLDRVVALKTLNAKMSSNASFTAAFEREAKIAALLSHPNIISVYDFGKYEQWDFFSMEYVDGENLLDAILRQGALTIKDVINYAQQLADALIHAHRHNVVHKDIKPRNVMIKRNGVIKLADLGLASLRLSLNGDNHESANVGPIMATPQYVAPEIIRHAAPDPRCDIYSFAATLYHAVTGVVPYSADNISDLLKMHLNAPIPDPRRLNPKIPNRLAGIIMRGMSKDPLDRQHSADEVLAELGQLQTDREEEKRRVDASLSMIRNDRGVTETARMRASTSLHLRRGHWRRWIAAGAIILAAAAIIAAVYWWRHREIRALTEHAKYPRIAGTDILGDSRRARNFRELEAPNPKTAPATEIKSAADLNAGATGNLSRADLEMERVRVMQSAATALMTADGAYAAGNFAEALTIYAGIREVLLDDARGETALTRAAKIVSAMADIRYDSWRDFSARLSEDDFSGAEEVARQIADLTKSFSRAEHSEDWLAIAVAARDFNAVAREALIAQTGEEQTVRVLVNDRERRAQIENRDGELFAVGKNNEKAIRISEVNAEDLFAVLPLHEHPQTAVGAMAYFASSQQPFASYERVAFAGGETTRRQAMMLADYADRRLPLWSFADWRLTPEQQTFATLETRNSQLALTFKRAGSLKEFQHPLPLKKLLLTLEIGDGTSLKLWASSQDFITFARYGDELKITLLRKGKDTAINFPALPDATLSLAFNETGIVVTQPDRAPVHLLAPGLDKWVANVFFESRAAAGTIGHFAAFTKEP